MLLVAMPSVNENKPIILFFCAAAPAGGAGWLALRERLRPSAPGRWLGFALAAGAIGVPVLLWIGHALHRDPPLPAGVAEACAWARAETPPEAIFLEPEGRRFLMNRVERDMLASDRTFVRECGYPADAIGRRLELIARLYGEGALTVDDRALLAGIERPVYAFYLRAARSGGDDREAPRPDGADFVRVYRNGDSEIYRFRPRRAETGESGGPAGGRPREEDVARDRQNDRTESEVRR